MNKAAKFVLVILGAVILMFALAAVVYPWHGKPVPAVVEGNIKELLIAFVAILARTGSDPEVPASVKVTNPPSDPVNTAEAS
ncbi:MAG: hypothetical protein ACO1SV_27590 [Fimbriimonas sp.]